MKNLVEKEIVGENILPDTLKIKKKFQMEEVSEKYDVLTLMLMFFFFGFIGWILEVFWMFIKDGIIVNRGTLIGPCLPIYGYSCVFILYIFTSDKCKKITQNSIITFFAIMIMCSVAEYITSVFLELFYGLRWWDYSREFLNIEGRVCLENSILFGIGGCLCLYKIAPTLNKYIQKIPKKAKKLILSVLIMMFLIDNVYCWIHPHTGFGITESEMFIKTLKFL